ncbi:GIY-YIG nuclease family protein [Vannielia litorea]|uniref:GIY-YIG nuclease family protein n=1 Tax=Vannielia litorea TaxID=1217970 RepID=UPI001BCCBA0D|nr:GIY-YIG nuclease family protein [Vannielia litorea]MBS8225645.1 GIY-YIG nuclease family protein [Vannielia litorea]
MDKQMAVYIMTNKPRGTLYIGVTGGLVQRIWQHRTHALPGFTDLYNLDKLAWFEMHEEPEVAIQRKKSLKRWYRRWKIDLIEKANPGWRDLWYEICPEAEAAAEAGT